jgi:redox-sensitive bicupin YhaK (pirin superfamily)
VKEIRRGNERGHADHGWLKSQHSFSFADYHDPEQVHFGPLRVINEDRVAPGAGFGTHGHRDMEIVSYVLSGGLEHKDSLGTGSVIRPGDVQRMTAGTGVRHSEKNASETDPVHFLQIWILPARRGLAPGYEQKHYPDAEKRGRLRLVGSPDGSDGSITIHQDVRLYAGLLDKGQRAAHTLAAGRAAYVHVARGAIEVDGQTLREGDGAALIAREAATLTLAGAGDADQAGEALLFDLP